MTKTYRKIVDGIDGEETLIETDTMIKDNHYTKRQLLEEKQRVENLLAELDKAEIRKE